MTTQLPAFDDMTDRQLLDEVMGRLMSDDGECASVLGEPDDKEVADVTYRGQAFDLFTPITTDLWDAAVRRIIDDEGFKLPDTDRPPCVFCESWGDEGEKCSHADFLNHFGTFEEWERNPSLIIGREIGNSRCESAGFYDDEDGKCDQELAEQCVAALLAAGWQMTPPTSYSAVTNGGEG